MKFNLKVIFVGGLAMYVAQWILSLPSEPLIHEGILTELYIQTQGFWRPELNQQPPDMVALLPRWITVGVIAALIQAAICDKIRGAFDDSGLVRGLKSGLVVFCSTCVFQPVGRACSTCPK